MMELQNKVHDLNQSIRESLKSHGYLQDSFMLHREEYAIGGRVRFTQNDHHGTYARPREGEDLGKSNTSIKGVKNGTFGTIEGYDEEKELAKSVFLSPYQLIDLNKIPDETLREAYYWFGAAALTAKHIRDFDLVSLVQNMIDLLNRLKEEGLDDYVFITLSYIFEASEVKDKEAFREIIRSGLSDEEKEKFMTLAELFRQEGLQEGMIIAEQYLEKGRVEGELKALHKTALNFLKLGISAEQVAQATTLPLQEVQDLWKKNASQH